MRPNSTVRVVGAGAFVPSRVVSNERIAKAIPGWTAEQIFERTGIRERRFLWDFDTERGQALPPPPEDAKNFYPSNNSQMCEVALRRALAMAGLEAKDLDGVFLVTCSADRLHFGHDVMQVHARTGMRPDAFAMQLDDGCAGTPYVIDMAQKMIRGGAWRTIAVIGSNFTSPSINRDVYTAEWVGGASGKKSLNAYLSMYVFGDGAGAVLLRGEPEASDVGILQSMSGNDEGELVAARGGGQLALPFQGRASLADHAFVVDGFAVARSYPVYMQRSIDGALAGHEALKPDIQRYYFHQPNKRLMFHFVERAGLPADRVACHVDRYGNTSAAGKLILLAEDLDQGVVRLGSGELVLIAAVGANVHYGSQLIRL